MECKKQQNFTVFQMYSNTYEQQYDLATSHIIKLFVFQIYIATRRIATFN